ncbi:MAG TPA: glycoside hydrolase family 127 protein [Limnochordia bacterium]|nr:glycoside hydrolase family 127 protein [Limnochordia bacterium]
MAVQLDVLVPCKKTELKGGLLADRAAVVREKMIPYQWKALNDLLPDGEPSHAIENLRIAAGEKTGEFKGMVFQDSDVAKWLEAVAYSLATHPDPQLEATADEVIDLVARAQQPDGYLNSYYTIVDPENRWTNLSENHELYCAGHFIEAAVAYYEATGKDKLLQVVCKLVEHIDSIFGPEEGKKKGYPGHEEIELALIRLYRVTRDERHLRLAQFFVEERGKQPNYFEEEARARGPQRSPNWGLFGLDYNQAHLQVREQTTVEGHAVRAMYLFSAVADLAQETGDPQLLQVSKTLWDNMVSRRMYITGGIGSQAHGEGFTIDYDLPSSRAYAETCAAIGLFFWGHRLLQLEPDNRYADEMERALYNGILSGMSWEGDRFFYVNPLEVDPAVCRARHDHRHVKATRQGWFACACCPPNLARLLTSLHHYIYSCGPQGLFVHFFADSAVEFPAAGKKVGLRQTTDYPWDGRVQLDLDLEGEAPFSLHVRLPGWCRQVEVKVNGEVLSDLAGHTHRGYLVLTRTWRAGDRVELDLAMPVEKVYAHPKVREAAGRIALQRGPVIYCLEEVDNGPDLHSLLLAREPRFQVAREPELGVPAISAQGFRLEAAGSQLYTTEKPRRTAVTIKAIPYFAWDNRRPGAMLVWMRAEGEG